MLPPGAPPGLELPPQGSVAKVASSTSSRLALTEEMEDVRKMIMQEADARLEEKADDLWESAVSELKRLDSQQEKRATDLEDEVSRCHAKLAALEAENAIMKEHFDSMNLAMLGGSWQGMPIIPQSTISPYGTPVQQGYPAPFGTGFPVVPEFPIPDDASVEVNASAAAAALAAAQAAAAAGMSDLSTGLLQSCEEQMPVLEIEMTVETADSQPALTTAAPPHDPPPGLSTSPRHAGAMTNLQGSPRANKSTEISLSQAIPEMKASKAEALMQSPTLRRAEEDPDYEALAASFSSPVPQKSTLSKGPRLMGTPSRPKSPQMFASPKHQTPKRTTRTSVGKFTPGKSPAVCPSPFTLFENGSSIFTFTLRRADDVTLGLDVSHSDADNFLHVKSILANGAVQAWNRQCSGGPAAGKAVMAGDKIVRVNDAADVAGMLNQCKEKQLLKITVVRGDPECEMSHEWVDQHLAQSQRRPSFAEAKHGSRDGPLTGSPLLGTSNSLLEARLGALSQNLAPPAFSLRADASDFVPWGTPPAGAKAMSASSQP